jgi:hypothetical protein
MKCHVLQIDVKTDIVKIVNNYETLASARFFKPVRHCKGLYEMTFKGHADYKSIYGKKWDDVKKEKVINESILLTILAVLIYRIMEKLMVNMV